MAENLIVCDNEYTQLSDEYKRISKLMNSYYGSLLQCLTTVANSALVSSETHDALAQLIDCARVIQNGYFDNIKLAADTCSDFISDIDIIDKELY